MSKDHFISVNTTSIPELTLGDKPELLEAWSTKDYRIEYLGFIYKLIDASKEVAQKRSRLNVFLRVIRTFGFWSLVEQSEIQISLQQEKEIDSTLVAEYLKPFEEFVQKFSQIEKIEQLEKSAYRHLIEIVVTLLSNDKSKEFESAIKNVKMAYPNLSIKWEDENEYIIISAMSEGDLDKAISKLKLSFSGKIKVGMPQVAYREALISTVLLEYLINEEELEDNLFAGVKLKLTPTPLSGNVTFLSSNVHGILPNKIISVIESEIRKYTNRGFLAGFPLIDFKAELLSCEFDDNRSDEVAFRLAVGAAFRTIEWRKKVMLIEPIVAVKISFHTEFLNSIVGDIQSRRGEITRTKEAKNITTLFASVPLANMFGYSNDLRSITGNTGTLSINFETYQSTPRAVDLDLKTINE